MERYFHNIESLYVNVTKYGTAGGWGGGGGGRGGQGVDVFMTIQLEVYTD